MKRVWRGLVTRVRDVVFRRDADREMDEELRFHIDMETEKHIRAGVEPAEARRRALTAFGGMERHRQSLREGRRVPFLEPLWHDVRFGWRAVVREPGLALVAAATIALGVGATTTVFSAANGLLLRPFPLPGVQRVMTIVERRSGRTSTGPEGVRIPYDRYLAYRDASRNVFASLSGTRMSEFSLRLADVTLAVNGALTSGNYFQTLDVHPVVGRAYTSDDADEVVISHRLWVSRFGASTKAIGSTVGLDGRTVTVVGVAPAGFGGTTFLSDQLWAPVGLRAAARDGSDTWMVPVGRLRPGVSRAQASARIDDLATRIPSHRGTTVHSARIDPVGSLPDAVRAPVKAFFAMLLGMALLVLLIAAANIAGVMLARGVARRRETAVRLALGAGRGRLVRHLLAESLILFGAGGLLGVGLAYLGAAWLARMPLPPQLPFVLHLDVSPDLRVLAFAIVLTVGTGMLFGLVPALRSSRPQLVPALKVGSAGSVGGDGIVRNLFVGGQVALAVTLMLTAALFVRSLRAALTSDLGFHPDGVVAATFDLGPPLAYDRSTGTRFGRMLLDRVRAFPGVRSAALAQTVLLSGSRESGEVSRTDDARTLQVPVSYMAVSPGYFATMGIDILVGRGFTDADDEGASPVVVINQTLADHLWPGQNPIGKRLAGSVVSVHGATVVGVTPAGRYATLTEEPRAFLFKPYSQGYSSRMAIQARAPGTEEATLRALATEMHDLDPNVALGTPVRMADLVDTSVIPQRFAAQLVGAFGLVGLILAALGIYGVLAYHVSRRTRELGVRRALGATSRHVTGAVVRQGAVLAAVGCVVGMAAGAGLARAVRSFLYGVHPLDPVTFTGVPALFLVVALVASWLPARRAMAVQASQALRSE